MNSGHGSDDSSRDENTRKGTTTRRTFLRSSLGAAGGLSLLASPITSRISSAQGDHDTVIVATDSDVTDWNEEQTYSSSWFPSTLVFSRLAAMDYGPDFVAHPDLATKWETSDDGVSYTFHLADGITWHDGTPFTSADVKFTYEGVVPNGGQAVSTMKNIERIDTPDAKTVVIRTKGVYAPFMEELSVYPETMILPKHLYEGTDWKNNPHNAKPVGTGPFKFDKREPSQYISLTRNDDYFKGKPHIQRVAYQVIPDTNVQVASLKANQVQALDKPPDLALIPNLNASPGVVVDSPPSPMIYFLAFNVTKAPFSDVKVRQALAYAIDRQEITDKVTHGLYKVCTGTYVQSVQWAFNSKVKLPDYDPQKAAQLLDAAGHPVKDGKRFDMEIWVSRATEINMAQIMIAQLKKVNVNASIKQMDNATWQATRKELKQDAYVYGNWWGPDPNEWATYTVTDGFFNSMGYSNKQVDELFVQATQTLDRPTRKGYYDQIQQIMLEDMPRIPIFDSGSYAFAHRKEFAGWFSEPPVSYRMDMLNVKYVGK